MKNPSRRRISRQEVCTINLWAVPCLTTLSVPPSGDPSDKMWLMYLSESEKHAKDISDAWKDDANGVLVFVRVSPSIVGLFLN